MIAYEYVMTSDIGFAPNPFYGVCTLACCKPKIRKSVANELFGKVKKTLANNQNVCKLSKNRKSIILEKLGLKATDSFDRKIEELFLQRDKKLLKELKYKTKEEFIKNQNIFIIGLAGKRLKEKLGKTSNDKNPIVYIMRVTDILTYDQYYNDKQYAEKIPHGFNVVDANDNTNINWCGDNIYKNANRQKSCTKELAVAVAFHHENGYMEPQKAHDLSGKYVLISSSGNFIYYGQKADGKIDIGESYRYAGHKKFYFNEKSSDNETLKKFLCGFDAIKRKGIIAPPINSKIKMDIE